MSNPEKEELAARIDDAVLSALRELNIRQSGAVVELVQRFSHGIVDHAEMVPQCEKQLEDVYSEYCDASDAWSEVIRKTCEAG